MSLQPVEPAADIWGQLPQAIRAAREQHRAGAGSVLDVLLRNPGFDEASLAQRLPELAGVHVLVGHLAVAADFERLSKDLASQWRCAVFSWAGGWCLAAEDPWDDALLLKVSRQVGLQLTPYAAPKARLASWLNSDAHGSTQTALGAAGGSGSTSGGPGQQTAASGPIVAFVDQALHAALDNGASDVHFECDRTGVTAKHRLDGVMVLFARLDGEQQAQECISRIKVLAQLDITERRLPQDGRIRFDFGSREVDLRVSIMPSVHGEDAVLRLLDKGRLHSARSAVSLDLLGFGASASACIRDLAALPSGMLLVTGPTGSGKTTTVYATLSEINTGLEKIITIEDPVEYELPGVLQIPVNERKGLTFAKGLRSILRHDPDRILVGEIRDAETAEIAVQSALTGHLVYTTVHANSVSDVVGRFRHFGLDMFGFMSALNGVVVQRLVRQLCTLCVATRQATPAEQRWLQACGFEPGAPVPDAKGCPHCNGTGYKGRFVIAEVHTIDDQLRDQVTEGAPLSVLKAQAQAHGVVPLTVQAAQHVVNCRTSAEEVKRVVGWL
jgi:general secretion pathway protein E